jgi:DNA-binding response OmpR family regulator
MTKKILVADNSITIQKIVAMAFEHENAVVEGISKGKDAFDRMQTFKPDIVLADIDMQDLTGFELSKKIKNEPNFDSTKVLLLASDFEDFNKNLFDSSGADDLISKPFKSEDIIKKVDDLLSEKSPDSIGETINLTPVDLDVSAESTESTIELSLGDLVEKEDSTINLSSA